MSYLGIIAAFPGELKVLVRGWQPVALSDAEKGDVAWKGRVGQTGCVAVAAGMGEKAAARACAFAERAVEADGGLHGLVSLGWAGALSCGVSAGQAYRVVEVVDAQTEARFKTSFPPDPELRLKLVTVDHVVQAPEKRQLGERFKAVFVDMEAAEVAKAASRKSIPFYCFKAVSDAQGDVFPDFAAFANPEGKLVMPALLGHLAVRPKYWRSMARIGKNSRIGAEALAESMREFLGEESDANNGGHR
jgi:adenosylhomocysteine nucleosidase